MVIKRGIILFISFFLIQQAYTQPEMVNVGGASIINISNQLPENLTSERSVVILDIPTQMKDGFVIRGDWKKLAANAHKTFRKIGVDPIAYVYLDDLNAGPEVNSAYLSLFQKRNVKNLIIINQVGQFPEETYTMVITGFSAENYIKNGQNGWKESDPELNQVMVRLGRQVLRQKIERSNLLIPELPEYLQDLVIFEGTRLENYPSRLKSLKLAVVAFQKVPADNVEDAELASKIAAYNQQVEEKNKRLDAIMAAYPFKYDIVTETNEDALYKAGYQYALMPLSSTGHSVKKVLNYPTTTTETHYMTNTFDVQSRPALKRIPISANVTKYYIKQTIVKDIHPGKVWDADVSWEQGLENFIYNLNQTFR